MKISRLIENDLDLDFQGHVISYSSTIIKGTKRGNFEHNDFCIYEKYSLEIFSHVSRMCSSFQYQFRKYMLYVLGQNLMKMTLKYILPPNQR